MAAALDEEHELPLDKLKIEVTVDGEKKMVSALASGWAQERAFAVYFAPALSDDGWVSEESREEWLDMMDLWKEDLHWLLRLPHSKFWSQMVYTIAVHGSLVEYLQHAPRPHDPEHHLMDDEMLQAWKEVHPLVFKVFLRMATYKESKKCHLTPAAFGKIIYDHFLFDIPKLMELCVLNGERNREVLYKMISNIFTCQPEYMTDLDSVVEALKKVYDTVLEELGVSDRCSEPQILNITRPQKEASDYMALACNIVDISMTVNAFLDVYSPACGPFHSRGFELKIASFYELAIPAITSVLANINSPIKTDILRRVKAAKEALLKTFRTILLATCIEPLLDDSTEATRHQNAEDFVQVLTWCISEKLFICDYDLVYPIKEDFHLLEQAGITIDKTRIDYMIQAIAADKEGIMLMKEEWEPGSALQVEAACNGTSHEVDEVTQAQSQTPLPVQELSGVELDSLISLVKDVLPELGDGFVEECLKEYSYSDEAVINAILEGSLPHRLRKLNRSKARSKPEAPLVDAISERANIYDGDEFDVFNRNDVDSTRIHKGKKKDYKDFKQMLNDKTAVRDLKKVGAFDVFASVEVEGGSYYDQYDDEYDDTYDDGTAATEEPAEQEDWIRPLNRKLNEMPDPESEPEEPEEQPQAESKPKDCFVPNPAELREKADRRRAEREARRRPRGGARGGGGRGGGGGGGGEKSGTKSSEAAGGGARPKEVPHEEGAVGGSIGQGAGSGRGKPSENQRRKKEAHKSSRANHDRKSQAQWKRGKGMLP